MPLSYRDYMQSSLNDLDAPSAVMLGPICADYLLRVPNGTDWPDMDGLFHDGDGPDK